MPIRRFLLLTLLFIVTSRLRAQDYYESKYENKPISLGIVFSPNVSWLRYGDVDVEASKAKIGYSYGLLADFAFAENYYFSTGLLINETRAASRTYLPGTNDINTIQFNDFKFQYAEIPFGVKLKSTQRYYRSYYGQFGFTAGIKLSSNREIASGGVVSKEDYREVDADADLFRLGLQIGGGVEWLLDHNLRLLTGLSFNNGFTSVVKDGSPKSTYIAFNLGILF